MRHVSKCCLFLLAFACSGALAQDVSPQDEYDKRIKFGGTAQPLGSSPFGETVSLFTGELGFSVADIVLEGSGPTITLRRTAFLSDFERGFEPPMLGNWDLSIPRIQTMVQAASRFITADPGAPGENWKMDVGNYARCSQFDSPYKAFDMWWSGYEFVTGEGDRQQILKRDPANTVMPSMTDPSGAPMVFPAVAKGDWQFGCLPQTSNLAMTGTAEPGEGFLAVAPDGTKYYLDYITGVRASNVVEYLIGGARIWYPRMYATMYASKVEDRFGNWVKYQYDGRKLVGITASDGRAVAIAWRQDVAVVDSITVQPGPTQRVWTYQYTGITQRESGEWRAQLQSVTLPDATRWSYAGTDFLPGIYNPNECNVRNGYPVDGSLAYTTTVTSPTGLKGVFVRKPTWHARSYMPSGCAQYEGVMPYLDPPVLVGRQSLVEKTISGPGVEPQTWRYRYSPPEASANSDACAATNTCPATRWVDVVEPDGDFSRHTISNRWDITEGRTLRVDAFDAASNLLRSNTVSYATPGTGPYPTKLGKMLSYSYGTNIAPIEQQLPAVATVTSQQGVTFSWKVDTTCTGKPYCLDAMMRPTRVTKGSSLGSTRTEETVYHDNPAKWVMGQIAKVTCVAPAECTPSWAPTGIVVSETTYDAFAMPATVKAYGKLQQTLTYNSTSTVASAQLGTLRWVKDGNNNVTTYGNWKRGVPQSIAFADNTTRSAVVDEHGQIHSVTDENGYTTSYDYDVMGRMTRVQYPSGDTVAWAETTQDFVSVAVPEHGIPAGHWRKTTSNGNRRQVTYYDARWRPILSHDYDATNMAGTLRAASTEYDSAGRVVFQSYPSAEAIPPAVGSWTAYDALGRVKEVQQNSELTSQANPQGLLKTTTDYLNGFETRVTNPRNQSTVTRYQVFDAPGYDAPLRIDHPEGAYTEITRDVFGKVTSLRRRNADGSKSVTRAYVYNQYQELCRSAEPETGSTLYKYDGAGNLVRTDFGLPASASPCAESAGMAAMDGPPTGGTLPPQMAPYALRTYDSRNRINTLAFLDGRGNQTWSYWPDGQIKTIVTDNDGPALGTVTNQYSYNKRRLLTGESLQQSSGGAWTIGYGYNTLGALAVQTYPNGMSVAYAPNVFGQPTQAASYATGVSYYPNGAIKQFTYGNGIVHAMAQNARQLPARSTDSGGGSPLDLGYGYDANANVAGITDYATGRQTRTMTYDGLDRLLTAQSVMFGGTDNVARYSYDVLDNLSTLQVNGRNYAYVYDDAQQLIGITNGIGGPTVVGLSYDKQGNLANKNGQGFKFDYGNRLREATNKETYRYDGLGRRLLASSAVSGDIRSQYSQGGQLLYQEDQRQAKNTAYVYLGGSLVARVVNSTAPATPVLTVPGFNTTGSYAVNWTTVVNANGYALQESAAGGAWSTVYSGAGTSHALAGKPAGNYAYRVRACLNAVCSNWSGTGDVAVQFAPASAPVPSAPTYGVGGNYTISWTAISGATSYKLEQSFNTGTWTAVYSGNAMSQTYTAKPEGGYGYRVQACNPAGCGPFSAAVYVQAVYVPVGSPSLTVPAISSNGSYSVAWGIVGGAATYRVEESINGVAWSAFYTGANLSVAVTGKGQASYRYRAQACNVAGCGNYSAIVTTQVVFPPASAPLVSAPGTTGVGNYTVSWTAVSGATSYQLGEQVNSGAWSTIYNGTATSIGLTGRAPATYRYRAMACNAGGCSAYSPVVTTSVTNAPPPVPTGLNGTADAMPDIRPPLYAWSIYWNASPGATSYDVQMQQGTSTPTIPYSGSNTYWDVAGRGSRQFWVRACNANGCSAWAGPITP